MVRLQKFLADAGVASRRASEKLILDGEVLVNGRVVTELGTKIDPDHDKVSVEGRPVKAKRKLYIAINKPPRYICSKADPEGRQTVHDLLPREWTHLQSVGRLDYLSEGLIFYTNDGDFALKLTHPRYGIRKKYRVTVKGEVTPEHLRLFEKGVFHDGELLRAESGRILTSSGGHSLVELTLSEGKNREVRRLFESQNLEIERLVRVQIGKVRLDELPKGKWRTLTGPEVQSLLDPSASARPERPERPEKSAAPPSAERPPRERAGRPERRFRGERPSSAGRPFRGNRGSRAAYGNEREGAPARPFRRERPDRAERPSRGEPSDRREQSFHGDRSDRPERPFRGARSARPSRGTRGPRRETTEDPPLISDFHPKARPSRTPRSGPSQRPLRREGPAPSRRPNRSAGAGGQGFRSSKGR